MEKLQKILWVILPNIVIFIMTNIEFLNASMNHPLTVVCGSQATNVW